MIKGRDKLRKKDKKKLGDQRLCRACARKRHQERNLRLKKYPEEVKKTKVWAVVNKRSLKINRVFRWGNVLEIYDDKKVAHLKSEMVVPCTVTYRIISSLKSKE